MKKTKRGARVSDRRQRSSSREKTGEWGRDSKKSPPWGSGRPKPGTPQRPRLLKRSKGKKAQKFLWGIMVGKRGEKKKEKEEGEGKKGGKRRWGRRKKKTGWVQRKTGHRIVHPSALRWKEKRKESRAQTKTGELMSPLLQKGSHRSGRDEQGGYNKIQPSGERVGRKN